MVFPFSSLGGDGEAEYSANRGLDDGDDDVFIVKLNRIDVRAWIKRCYEYEGQRQNEFV